MNHGRPAPSSAAAWLGATLIWLVFSVPLFIGLDRTDLRNDEAIYAYAVDKILETGDWLTPRIVPTEYPFLEKPPLKFWIVAGAMQLGLTPTNEFGMRVFDALFGAVAFAYILAFGWRVAGPIAGGVALVVLWTFDPFIFQALRGNHMEAPLIVSYAGGLWHFLRWSELEAIRRRRLHAFAVAGYAVLGFMTKFVAIGFLPIVAVAWLLTTRDGRRRLPSTWADWIWPFVASVAVVAPWFVYQSLAFGSGFWDIILGQHVVARLTGVLHTEHLQPWHFYFTQTWKEFGYGRSLLIVLAGLGVLVWQTWRASAIARLLLFWWLLPVAIISMGTSKLIYYALPFIPPLAIGAGWAASLLFWTARDRARTLLPLARGRLRSVGSYVDARPALRLALLIVSVICFALAVWTLVTGVPFTIMAGDVRVFRSSSVPRAIAIGIVTLVVGGWVRQASTILAMLLLILVVPFHMFRDQAQRTRWVEHPLRAARDCMLGEQRANRAPAAGVYLSSPSIISHPPFYYLRHVGEWQVGPEPWEPEATRRHVEAAVPVILSVEQWEATRERSEIAAVYVEDGAVLTLPGAYAACEAPILAQRGRRYVAGTTP